MKLVLSTFLKTVAGKAVLAAGIVTLGVGGAAAAGVADVPALLPSSAEQRAQDSTDDSTDESSEDSSEESSEESVEDSAGDEPTHGEVVSEFARTTELEGCEKGQAIAELASSKAAEHRQNPEQDHDPCAGDDESTATDDSADDEAVDPLAPAPSSDESDEGDESDDSDDKPGRAGERGNGAGKGAGKSGSNGGGNGRGK